MIVDDGIRKAYIIVIPTNNSISDYEIKPLIHKIEYNRIAKLNPLNGYYFNEEDNKKLALQDHINSSNSELNNIINKSLDELAKKHTIKVDTYIDNFDTHLTSYMDLINSVFKIQSGTKALHYIGYASDMKLLYVNYGEDYYSYDYTYIDRSIMLLDIFSEFGNNFLQNIDNYEIILSEDNEDYIIESNSNSYCNATYYINKETYLIDKITTDNRTNKFSYINDNILIPYDIDINEYPITVEKPILYLYPEKETEVSIYLENSELLTVSYPKYKSKWDVIAYPNGNIYDKETKRNYYSLYWESKIDKIASMDTGFVVKKENLINFLEEKLTFLGLNEREINEFIIYWLPILDKNEYNLIHFLTQEEVNEIVPISFSINPDTMIRVYIQVKPLNKLITIEEQQLYSKERVGFTTVDWGGIILINELNQKS